MLIEGLILTIALSWVLASLVPHTPVATTTTDVPLLRDAISGRLTGVVNDPLVEVAGRSAHESNLRGLSLHGVTYYYYIEGQQNFDPLSRGAVTEANVEKIFRDDTGPQPLVIYTITK